MIPSEILAVAAACCLALSGMFYAELKGQVGVVTLTRWQTITAFLLTGSIATMRGGWSGIAPWHLRGLAGSGFFAIIVASSALNASIFVLGPRRSALVFSLNAPLTAILGYFVLGETIDLVQLGGIGLVVAGVILAISFVTPDRQPVADGGVGHTPSTASGVLLGILASFGQAIGTLFARPVMASGVDAFAAMAVRAGVAAAFFLLLAVLPIRLLKQSQRASWPQLLTGVAGACIGIGFGMSLLMAALAHGKIGVVSTLSSLVPILVLPMIWIRTGQAPPRLAWVGAVLAVTGTTLLALG